MAVRDGLVEVEERVGKLGEHFHLPVKCSDNDEDGNWYPGRRVGVPPPREERPHTHHTLRRRTFRSARGRWSPHSANRVVIHGGVPDCILNSVLDLALALDLGTPPFHHEVIVRLERHRGARERDAYLALATYLARLWATYLARWARRWVETVRPAAKTPLGVVDRGKKEQAVDLVRMLDRIGANTK